MQTLDSLFDAFAPVSKEAWLKKIEKELKGQPLEGLDWALGSELTVSPFANREDWPFETPPLPAERLNNDWEIGEEIPVHTVHEARQLAQEAIENAVQAPRWTLKRPLRLHEWQELLGGIDMALVSTHIAGIQKAEDFPAIWKTFFEMVQSHPQRLSLRGSIYIHGIAYAEEGFAREMAPLLERGAMALPGFRLLTVNGHLDYKGPDGVVDELTGILARGASIMERYTSLGLAPDRVHHHIQLSVAVGTAYFLEIAKIRALKLLWAHLMDAYGITHLSLPSIDVRFAPASQTADPHQTMIRAATQAMSAVIAGVDRLTVQPAEDSAFGRRIARNVQHLLKMESYLDRVIDPAAGSYYIEKLTDALAEKAWTQFQNLK
jgi:methylmalonyl-CoA mutase